MYLTITMQSSESVASKLALSRGLGLLLDQTAKRTGEQWLNTSAAAFYCMDRTGRTDIEWHNVLMENRREQNGVFAVLVGKKPRGNAARLGELPCTRYSRKVYYAVSDLNRWLALLPSSMTLH